MIAVPISLRDIVYATAHLDSRHNDGGDYKPYTKTDYKSYSSAHCFTFLLEPLGRATFAALLPFSKPRQ